MFPGYLATFFSWLESLQWHENCVFIFPWRKNFFTKSLYPPHTHTQHCFTFFCVLALLILHLVWIQACFGFCIIFILLFILCKKTKKNLCHLPKLHPRPFNDPSWTQALAAFTLIAYRSPVQACKQARLFTNVTTHKSWPPIIITVSTCFGSTCLICKGLLEDLHSCIFTNMSQR